MKRLIFTTCAALALLLDMPQLTAAHALAPAIPTTSAAAVAGQRVSTRSALPAALSGAMALEQHRGGRSSGRATGSPGRMGGGSGTIGQAGPRSSVPFRRPVFISPFFFSPFGFSPFGFGFGFADPFFWGGWGYPFGWGYPYGALGYGGYGYPGYGAGYGSGYAQRRGGYQRYGSVKFDVKPKSAEVYVDGYYMGQVSDFGGVFHHLDLAGGEHKIEIRAPGFQPLNVDMKVMPGRTVNYRGRLQPGSGGQAK
jgi:hypothetical protein